MKKALIIHGTNGAPTDHWYQNEKRELERLGYFVFVPQMPNSANPDKDEWVKAIERYKPDQESILIGFSLGGTAVLRFLEHSDQKIKTVVLIATPIDDIGRDDLRNFFGNFGFEKIRNKADKFIVINQDHDHIIPIDHGYNLAKGLGVDLTIVSGENHFLSPDMDLDLINSRL